MSWSEALQTVRRPVADALGSVMVRYGLGIALVPEGRRLFPKLSERHF